MKEKELKEYYSIVDDILKNKEFIKRKEFPHHGEESVYTHSLRVSMLAYKIAKKLKVNKEDAAIAGLLHDMYHQPWQTKTEKTKFFKQHGFTHAKEALDTANLHFKDKLNKKIEDAILRHMFPLNIIPPKYTTGWIVTISDKLISLEVLKDIKNLPKYLGFIKKK